MKSPAAAKPSAKAPKAATLKAPPEVLEVTCETTTLKWEPPEPDDSATRDLQYELVASLAAAADSPVSVITTAATEYKVDHLEHDGTEYIFKVRARDNRHPAAGWGPYQSVLSSTTQLPVELTAPDAPKATATLEWPDPPKAAATLDAGCTAIQLELPALRGDCARETSLVLEYRVAGDAEWAAYSQQGLTTKRLQVKVPDATLAYEFRLVSRRAELSSPASDSLGPITACGAPVAAPTGAGAAEPLHSDVSVAIAASLVFALLGTACCCLYRAGSSASGDPLDEKPLRKQHHQVDQESSVGIEDEVTVHYDIQGAVQSGILPLDGVSTVAQLLEEVADFGCELIEGAEFEAMDIEVYYEDENGKQKKLTSKTPLSAVLVAGTLS
eukprot:7377414-Prymnesium_polylepis.1